MEKRLPALAALGFASCLAFGATSEAPDADGPRYTADGQVIKPQEYREWPLIGTGLNMAYGPAGNDLGDSPPFTNVFVSPASYKSFMQTGKWPDRTVFVLEIRSSIAVNSAEGGQNGWYQGEVVGLEVEVKDERRFPGGWAFFGLGVTDASGAQIPTSASCYSCHKANAAVENTFVQFYPVLRDVAKDKGTLKNVPRKF
jgi:hypothetical protein